MMDETQYEINTIYLLYDDYNYYMYDEWNILYDTLP